MHLPSIIQRILPAGALLLVSLLLAAQPERQAENWHFSGGITISFENGTPALAPPSSQNAFEGAVSLSDTDGRLLFYTNGGGQGAEGLEDGVIWDRNGNVLYDMGNTEGGGYSARQSAIAIPSPTGQDGIYYLFTVEDNENTTLRPPGNGLRVFVLDMNQNDGLGAVLLADSLLIPGATEALDATPIPDGSGYWIMVMTGTEEEPQSGVVSLTAAGISEPVFSEFPVDGQRLTFSPDGRFLFVRDNLYAFDNATGTMSDPIATYANNTVTGPGFTTDSRYLYLIEAASLNDVQLVRYDLSDQTRLVVEQLAGEGVLGHSSGAFQLGPNGHLYFVESTLTAPGTPNLFGLSEIVCTTSPTPEVNRSLIPLSGVGTPANTSSISLPQYVDAIFADIVQSDTSVLEVQEVSICPDAMITLMPAADGATYDWSDGSSDPTLVVAAPGTYAVTVTDGCQVFLQTFTVEPADPDRGLSLVLTEVEGGEVCVDREATLRLTGPGADTTAIVWFDNSVADTLRVSLDPSATYAATVSGVCGPAEIVYDGVVAPTCTCTPPVFPEIISANLDGTNDGFRAFTDCPVLDYRLSIFNRWGQEVFSSADPAEAWDGTVDGQPQNIGTYLFLSSYRLDGAPDSRTVEGQFALVR